MKNTRCTDFCVPKNSSIKQLLKTMRVTIFLLFFCVFSTIAGTVNSQNARVSIHKTNVPLEEILNEIEHQTDYLFMYSNNIDVKERTSIRVSEKPVSEVLKKLLGNKIAFTGTISPAGSKKICSNFYLQSYFHSAGTFGLYSAYR